MSLKFIICGLEHTGTTLISDLFRQIPGIDAGFEGGALLRRTPAEFPSVQPFYRNMLNGWELSQDDMDACCAEPDHVGFYKQLQARAKVLSPDTKAIFDKTPRYLSELTAVLGRTEVPVVVSYKDPRAIVCSDFKRSAHSDFDAWYHDYMPQKRSYVRQCYVEFDKHQGNRRVATVGLEELAMNSRAAMERIFAHVGERFELGYTVIKELRYAHTRKASVTADFVFEYMRVMTPQNCARVLEDFGECQDWIYD